jgi:hypothetical protein
MRRNNYEADPQFNGAFRVRGWPAVAWRVAGWETEPNEETEFSGYEVRTGKLLAVMVGDDAYHRVDPEDLIPLKREDYCGGCGQVGCKCDAYEED